MRQSDDRDSEPDYLLRPTRHGQGGALLGSSAFLFGAQVTDIGQDLRDLNFKRMELQRHL